jgi:hypothetical protein
MVEYGLQAKKINTILGGQGISGLTVGEKKDSLKWKQFKGQIPEFIIYKKKS